MTLKEAVRILVRGDGSTLSIIDRRCLRTLFRDDNDAAFNKGLRALVECGLLERFAPGVYCNHGARRLGLNGLALVVAYLRPRHLSYLSYEFALSDVGSISQIPFVFTIATTGSSGEYRTPHGNVEFTHVSRTHAEIARRCVYDGRFAMLFAPPEMALEDFRRSRRSSGHLVDMEDHAEIVAEWAERDAAA